MNNNTNDAARQNLSQPHSNNTNVAASSATQQPVSLHQIHSLMLLYPRLASLVWAPIVAPILIPCAFHLVNAVTAGHAVYALALTAVLWQAGIGAIHHYAGSSCSSSSDGNNDADAVDKALAINEVRLPVLAASTSIVLVGAASWVLGDVLAWFPSVQASTVVFFQLVCTIALLQGSVFLRYFGPLSISK